jgi:diguanylate cyclase (GGDEF)-like protein
MEKPKKIFHSATHQDMIFRFAMRIDQLMRRTVRLIETLDSRVVLMGSILSALVLGYLDYLSGFELSFSLFYLLPVFVTAWFVNRNSAIMVSGLCALAWAISNRLAGEVYSHTGIIYWNAFVRLSIFEIISLLLAYLKQALQKEREFSRTDYLTGITNPRSFYELASIELLRGKRSNQPMTIAYVDLDNFKNINDRFGHSTGDALLRVVAETMQTSLRRTDIVARMGGDEFVILLPEANEESSRIAITRMHNFLLGKMEQNSWEVTFSIGVVTYYVLPATAGELLQQVDELMYEVKATGKNSIRFERVG